MEDSLRNHESEQYQRRRTFPAGKGTFDAPRPGTEDTQQDDARYAHPLLPRRSEGYQTGFR